MPTVADYKVLRDSSFDLTHGGKKQIAFDLPDNLSDNKLILAYQARPLSIQIKAKIYSALQSRVVPN